MRYGAMTVTDDWFDRMVKMSDAVLTELHDRELHDRLMYALWSNEPYSHGVLRQFARAMAVAGYTAAVFP